MKANAAPTGGNVQNYRVNGGVLRLWNLPRGLSTIGKRLNPAQQL
jgi:hypothetical protein